MATVNGKPFAQMQIASIFLLPLVFGAAVSLAAPPSAPINQAKPARPKAQSSPAATAPAAGKKPAPQADAKSAEDPGFNTADPNVQANTGPDIFSGLLDDTFVYDPRGRRDPFSQVVQGKPMAQGSQRGPLLPLQRFELSQLKLTGILWDVRSPKAIFKDPGGQIHVVVPYSKVGPRNGYIAQIREGEIIVVETVEQDGRLVSTAQVVKISR